jgi:hypothetical protein
LFDLLARAILFHALSFGFCFWWGALTKTAASAPCIMDVFFGFSLNGCLAPMHSWAATWWSSFWFVWSVALPAGEFAFHAYGGDLGLADVLESSNFA